MQRVAGGSTSAVLSRAGFSPFSVDLVPPSLKATRRSRRARQGAVLATAAALLASFGLGAWSHADVEAARGELETSRTEAESLSAERANYTELLVLERELARNLEIEQTAMERDVDWAPLVQQVVEALGSAAAAEGSAAAVDSFLIVAITSDADLAGGTDVLGVPGIGRVSVDVQTSVLPDVGVWTAALNAIPGLSDPRITTATLVDQDGVSMYMSSVDITVVPGARSCRWFSGDLPDQRQDVEEDPSLEETCGG